MTFDVRCGSSDGGGGGGGGGMQLPAEVATRLSKLEEDMHGLQDAHFDLQESGSVSPAVAESVAVAESAARLSNLEANMMAVQDLHFELDESSAVLSPAAGEATGGDMAVDVRLAVTAATGALSRQIKAQLLQLESGPIKGLTAEMAGLAASQQAGLAAVEAKFGAAEDSRWADLEGLHSQMAELKAEFHAKVDARVERLPSELSDVQELVGATVAALVKDQVKAHVEGHVVEQGETHRDAFHRSIDLALLFVSLSCPSALAVSASVKLHLEGQLEKHVVATVQSHVADSVAELRKADSEYPTIPHAMRRFASELIGRYGCVQARGRSSSMQSDRHRLLNTDGPLPFCAVRDVCSLGGAVRAVHGAVDCPWVRYLFSPRVSPAMERLHLPTPVCL